MNKLNGNILMDFIELYNGIKLPNIALGTSKIGYTQNFHNLSNEFSIVMPGVRIF